MKPVLSVLLAVLAALFLPAIAAGQCPGPCPYHAVAFEPFALEVIAQPAALEVIATPAPEPLEPIPAAAWSTTDRRRPVLRVVRVATAPARFLLHRQPVRRVFRVAIAPARFLVRHRPGLIFPRR